MARSTMSAPFLGNCSGSDAAARRYGNRVARHAAKAALARTGDGDAIPSPRAFGACNPWNWPRDGRRYIANPEPDWLRK